MDEAPKTRPSLLVRIRNCNDHQAWTEFVEIYEPLIYRLARRKGFQDADAAELTQEVFVAVASAIDRWRPDPGRGKFRAWLFRIARNLMINLLVHHRRHPPAAGDTSVGRLLEMQASPDGPESVLFDREYKRQTFHWAAEQIRDEFRESTWRAFWRTAVDGRPVRQVADELELSPGAVYVARSRVMARLRETVEGLDL